MKQELRAVGGSASFDEVGIHCLDEELLTSKQEKAIYPSQFFILPTTMAAVGPRGRGKTYSLVRLDKYLVENEYITRIYAITPTFDSNMVLKENLPIALSDVYDNIDEGKEAVFDIEAKVNREAAFYDEMKVYKEVYLRGMQAGFEELKEEDQEYLLGMQDPIIDYLSELLQRMDHCSVYVASPPWIERLFENLKLPKEMDLKFKFLGGGQWEGPYKPSPEEEEEEKEMMEYLYPPLDIPRPAPLLIIDDMSHSSLYSTGTSNPLTNLVLRHRHLGKGKGLTIQFAVQTFKGGMQRALRANTMQFLLFKTNDNTVLEDIYEELGALCTKEQFKKVYKQAVRDKHDFLLVDVNAIDEHNVFRRGFETVIHVPDPFRQMEEVN